MFQRIVVGTDGSETAGEAVRRAGELARASQSSLEIVSAYEPVAPSRLREEAVEAPKDLEWAINPREDVDHALERARGLAGDGLEVTLHARQGNPADAILDVAEEVGADLIVVGNKGMTGARRFLLGSVPNRVSHHAPCAVLIIRTT